jgi:hypothetical protein
VVRDGERVKDRSGFSGKGMTMKIHRFMTTVWFAVFLFSVPYGTVRGDEPAGYRPFDRAEYESGDFDVTTHTYSHGKIRVKLIQAKRLGPRSGEPPYACRAWLEVFDGKNRIWEHYFDDMSPSGFSYGLSVPQKQPSPDYFAVVKNGDFDGRLFLIDRKGTVTDLPGGFYFVSFDRRYLYSEYAAEIQEFVVFDLLFGKIVLDTKTADSSPLPGDIYDWYHDGRKFYFTIVKPGVAGKGLVQEDRRSVYEVKLNPPGIARVTADFSRLHHKKWDFDPRTFKDCCSDPAKKGEERSGNDY